MNKKAKIWLFASLTSLVLGATAIVSNNVLANLPSYASLSNGRGENNSLELSATTYVTGETYSSGSFTWTSTFGNGVVFSYDKAMKNADGLLTLNKTYVGNPSSTSSCYFQNDDPITSVTSLSVETDGTLVVFGSNDKTEYYKLAVFEGSGSTEMCKGYLYYKLANGNQDKTPLKVNSVTFNYSCVEEDYTDEASDLTNGVVVSGSIAKAGGVVYNSTTYFDGFKSNASLEIKAPFNGFTNSSTDMYKWQFAIKLPQALKGSDLYNMQLSFEYNSLNCKRLDNQNYTFYVYPTNSTSSYVDKDNLIGKIYLSHEVGWTRISYDFSAMTALNNDTYKDTEFAYLLVRPKNISYVEVTDPQVPGSLFIDQMRLQLINDYPPFDTSVIDDSPEEKDDLSNKGFNNGYNTTDQGYDYEVYSSNSYRSRKTLIGTSDDTCRWNYEGFIEDLTNKVILFDAKVDDLPSNAYFKVAIPVVFNSVESRFEVTAKTGNEAGVSISDVEGFDGWKHYVVDVSTALEGVTPTAKPFSGKNSFGLVVSHAPGALIYVDNMYIQSTITTTFVVNYDTGGYGDIYMFGDFGTTPTWSEDTAIHMTWNDGNNWKVTLEVPCGTTYTFKFVKVFFDSKTYENGDNRTFKFTGLTPEEYIFYWQA